MAPPDSSTWTGAGLSQDDFMLKDTVLVLDNADNVMGSASKKDAHVFSTTQPHGILHRAFSVFLVDQSDGRLLLQQRAQSKITFPNVWTNTCCSHPLHGMQPNEVDTPADVALGTVPGIKQAAIRKLQHELGITQLKVDDFVFVTRLHYWAADTITHGATTAPWGEHEIDYVLIATVPSKTMLTVQPHRDEVEAVQWVNATELASLLADETLLFSPWFRIIVDRWWKDTWWQATLQGTLSRHIDYARIHEFDPPRPHWGGAGHAQPLFLPGDASKKQGAYGKVITHQESKVSQLLRLDEVWSALTLLYLQPLQSNLHTPYIQATFPAPELAFCDHILQSVSRSFAAVIRQLPPTLLVDIMIFYLVLRALDTIEDDTTHLTADQKVAELHAFDRVALLNSTSSLPHRWHGIGEGDERRLLEEFPQCQAIYQCLAPMSRTIIADITRRMAHGMAEFVRTDMGQGTQDVDEYNRYCHFVAGLVGEGLSRLFAASGGLERASLANELHLSNQMGLFLQKTNIIRDYREDYVDKRAFWPQSIWKKYSKSGDLGYFVNQSDFHVRQQSLACLNELVTDALELVPDCLTYMSKLQCVEVFRFCAIPQVMAIATLDKCYANHNVFTGVVKIRKGLSCKLLLKTNHLGQLHETFHGFATSILQKANTEHARGANDPSHERTVNICRRILNLTTGKTRVEARRRWTCRAVCAGLLGAAPLLQYIPAVMENIEMRTYAKVLLFGVAGFLYWYGPWTVRSDLKSAKDLKQH